MKLSDVKFLKMKRKDYAFGGGVVGRSVQNFPEWQKWMKKYWGVGVSRKKFDKGCLINCDNRERFKKHFGKCAFTFNGSHYYHGWLADLGTAQVIVFTAREHGTCYEVVTERDEKNVEANIPRVLEFMDMIAGLPE